MRDYTGISLTPSILGEIFLELYDGKIVKKRDGIEEAVNCFIENGGIVDEGYGVNAAFKRMTQILQKKGVLSHHAYGIWRFHSDIKTKKTAPTEIKKKSGPQKVEYTCDKEVGAGSGQVYVYYLNTYKEFAELKGETEWRCKIGMTNDCAGNRVGAQSVTALPEKPHIALVIRNDHPEMVEKIIHNILYLKGKAVDDCIGSEWYMTNPKEVEQICYSNGLI